MTKKTTKKATTKPEVMDTAARRDTDDTQAQRTPTGVTEFIQRKCDVKRCRHCGQIAWKPWLVYKTVDRIRYVKSTCRACNQPATDKVVVPATAVLEEPEEPSE